MASHDLQLKIQVVRKSMATFAGWLDSCDRLLQDVPPEMEQCNSSQLRDLALRFKDLLLQMKERCSYMQEINILSKEIEKTRPSEIPTEVKKMNKRFAGTCMQAKQQYSTLSTLLAAAIAKKESTRSSSNSPQEQRHNVIASVAETTAAGNLTVAGSDGYEERIRSLEGSPVVAGRRRILPVVSSQGQGRGASGSRESNRKAGKSEKSTTAVAVQGRGGRTNEGGYKVKVLPSKSKSKLKSKPKGTGSPPNKSRSGGRRDPSSKPNGIQDASIFFEGVDGSAQASSQEPLEGFHGKPQTGTETEATKPDKAAKSQGKAGPKPPVPAKSAHLRERILSEKSLAAKSETLLSDEKSSSDKWETISVHSLQNRIVYSTGDTASAHSMDSLDLSGLSTSTIELSQELDTSDLQKSSGDSLGNSRKESDLESRDKNKRSAETHSSSSVTKRQVEVRSGSHSSGGNVNGRDLGSKLAEMSAQIQDFVHSIAEHKTCGLQSLALELHLGEIKAMLTLLEVQELELVRLRATFSPSAQWRLEDEQGRGCVRANAYLPTYPPNEITKNREEVLKLSERVELLRKHCSETVTQTEEVLEFVMQFEGEVKIIRSFLSSCRKTVEEARGGGGAYSPDVWRDLKESLAAVNKYRTQLASIEQLSTLLLCLEPIFDGDPVRQEIKDINSDFQNLVLVLFGQLEVQARSRTEQLLLEVSVMSSWATETELSVQALEKRSRNPNGMSTKIAATRETLIKELQNRKATLQTISEQLQPITAVLSPDQYPSLKDLLAQLKANSSTLSKIEKGLHSVFIQPKAAIAMTNGDTVADSTGLKLSGQEDVVLKPSGSKKDKGYDKLDIVEPFVSPLTEDDQVPSRALDSAIENLPRQPQPLSTQRRGYVDIDISTYDRPRLGNTISPSHRPLLGRTPPLHEQLLQFISQEWAGLPKEALESQDTTALRDSIGCLANPIDRTACTEFMKSLDKLHASLKGVYEQIPLIKTPSIPDLERVHSAIDQCQKLQSQLERAHPLLGQHNEESLSLLLSLPRGAPSARVSQLMEIRLFDVSMIWHGANMQVAAKLRELRLREGDVNTLHRQLGALSRALSDAKELLSQKKSITYVGGYLDKCKEMHGRLSDLSVQRGEVSSVIRESITHSPQSPLCQNLLDELGEIDTQWVNTVTALVNMPVLEPILIEQMCSNVTKEMATMETTLQEVKGRELNLEVVREKCRKCQECVKQAKHIQTSLSSAEVRLKELQSSVRSAGQKDAAGAGVAQPMAEAVSLTQAGDLVPNGVTGEPSGHDRLQGGVTSHQIGVKGGLSPSNSVSGSKVYVEMMITPYGPQLASINYDELLQTCLSLLPQANKIVSEAEANAAVIESDRSLLEQIYTELKELQLWAKDTKAMLQVEEQLPGRGEQGGTSQHRTKNQAICHQVVARQPRMESLQSLSAQAFLLPLSGVERAGQGRVELEKTLTNLYCDWDEICQQCVPAGALPLLGAPLPHDFSLQAPTEFEDASQMVEWLILVESKLQPEKIIIGDFAQVRSVLRELQLIERELTSKEVEFRQFMSGGSGTSPDLAELLSLRSQTQTPVPRSTPSPKCVKFVDEDSLERELRIQDIKEEIPKPETPIPYDQNPYPAYPAMEWGQQHFGVEPRMKQSDSQSTISLSLSQMASPTSSMPDELYQLTILWNGIWTTLTQKRQKLESTLGIWRAFESKKEAFCNFLTKAEERMNSFFVTVSSAKDLAVIQTEIVEQKGFVEEVNTYKQQLSILKDLARDLVTHHHSSDDTHDLQDAMVHINNRWKAVINSLSQHQPTINALCTRWTEFYNHFHTFHQWLRNMDIEMSNLNPFVAAMATVRSQLTKLKEIQQELNSHEGALETIRLQAYKLLQGIGGCHVNAAAIHSKLDNMARRWDHLEKLAQERKSALEQALTEKQDLLARMADCLAWLNQAERHLANQRPLGTDYHRIHEQYEVQQGFWQETQEQKPKMEMVISAGNQVAMDMPGGVAIGEGLKAQCSAVKERWERVYRATELWGKTLEKVNPEMEHFQVLYSDGAQQLTDAEMQAANFEPVSTYVFTLRRQLEMLQLFESTLVSIGNVLEDIVASQKRQLEMGVKVAPDLIAMVKRFHQRWNELKQFITDRRTGIEKGLQKYDMETLGIASVPRGWHRAKTDNGTPYYINALAGNKSQWSHPELSMLYHRQKTMHGLPSYPSSAYPIALKLRAVQRVTQLNLLRTRNALEAFTEHECHTDPHRVLSCSDMALLTLSMFQRAEEEPIGPTHTGSPLDIEDAVELTTCWLRDVYDFAHEGVVSCLSFQVAVLCMSRGRLEEKYRGLFKVISRNQDSIDLDQLTEFLEQAIQVPQSVSETQYCSLHEADISAKECFKQHVGVGRLLLPQFISWLQTEPKPLAWLSVLHRLAASEAVQHDAKCTVCKTYPIVGFRYRCLQCSGVDMCQTCYWAGKTTKGHDRSKHFMEEFCAARNSGDEVKDFLKLLHRSFRKKKKPLLQQEDNLPQVVGDHAPSPTPPSPYSRATSPPARRRHSVRSSVQIRDLPDDASPVQSHKPATSEGAGPGNMALGRPLPSSPRRAGNPGTLPIPPRVPPKPSRRQGPQQEEFGTRQQEVGGANNQARGGAKKLDASLSRITKENRHLSEGLKGLRERRDSTSSSISSQTDGAEPSSPEQIMKQRTTFLQGRVELLQEHNNQLESCIRQLKMIASMSQQTQQLTPVEVPSRRPVLNGTLKPAPTAA